MSSTCRQLGHGDLDLLDFLRLALGRDYCDDQADAMDGLVRLPAAIELVEQKTGRSIAPACWEKEGTSCNCEIRLPFTPVCEVLSLEYRDGDEWRDVDPASYELVSDPLTACVRKTDGQGWPWCGCKCRCDCGCPLPDWRIRWSVGTKNQLLPASPMLLQAVVKIAEWLETEDPKSWESIERLLNCSAVHRMSGAH